MCFTLSTVALDSHGAALAIAGAATGSFVGVSQLSGRPQQASNQVRSLEKHRRPVNKVLAPRKLNKPGLQRGACACANAGKCSTM